MNKYFILSATLAQPELNDPSLAADILAIAENVGLDLAILGAPGALPFDPIVVAAWAAPITKTIGLAACVSTAVSHPFHAARSLSAIDFLTSGRAAWNPVTGVDDDASVTEDMIGAARSLWDSWSPDALIIDKQSGRYLDASKVRLSNYEGPHFKVRGPLNAARPPQGHPVLVGDGTSPVDVVGVDLAVIDDGQAVFSSAKKLRRVERDCDIPALVAAFEADEITGVHWTIEDAGQDIPAIAEFATAVAGLRQTAKPGATLRDKLCLPLAPQLVSKGESA